MMGVWLAFAAVCEVILILPFYIIWLIVGLRVIARFCSCKKFKKSNKQQVALLLTFKKQQGKLEDDIDD